MDGGPGSSGRSFSEGDWISILVEPNDDRRGGVASGHIVGEAGGGSEGVRGGDTSWTTLDDANLCRRASSSLARTLGSSGGVTDISARRTVGVLI